MRKSWNQTEWTADAETVKQAWLEVFPNSHVTSSTILGSTCVALYLFRADECANGIQQNDPLQYRVWFEGENVRESELYILTKPPEGANLVYGSARKRRQTIKGADHVKLVRRFRKVREWIESLDLAHDISAK